MKRISVEQQLHGYRSGHQLLASSTTLPREDQDLVDRLSDLSGPLQPGQVFNPYLTTYPLPSERFYVVARTWQDRAAPRAGCVLSRSLIVKMSDWLADPPLQQLLTLLLPFQREQSSVSVATPPSEEKALPPVEEPRITELVEALFLEARQPIVFFEASGGELIVTRLLSALWPALRRQFATCTYSLAPRSLAGRPFDLLFAPKISRIRFADWPGRKIDAGPNVAPRHRWTEPAARQIFQAPTPTLAAIDTLGILRADERGDENALRLSLLWNELAENARTSANAVLGMLDILNSRNLSVSAPQILPSIQNAIALSARTSTPIDHLQFLLTLSGKFVSARAPFSLLRALLASARAATARAAVDGITFLSSCERQGRTVPRILCSGVAGGLAEANISLPESKFSELHAETRLRLVSSDPRFAALFSRSIVDNTSEEWTKVLTSTLEFPEESLLRRARSMLLPLLTHASQAPLLNSALDDVSAQQLVDVTATLWKVDRFRISAFDEPLLSAATSAHARESLRNFLGSLPATPDTDRLLAKIIQFNKEDISWLQAASLDPSRRAGFISQAISRLDDFHLERELRSSDIAAKVLSSLEKAAESVATAIIRVLLCSKASTSPQIELGIAFADHVDDQVALRRFARLVIDMLFSGHLDTTNRPTIDLLSSLVGQMAPREIIARACEGSLGSHQVNSNLCLLNRGLPSVRPAVLSNIDQLAERVSNLRRIALDESAVRCLAELVDDAGGTDKRAQTSAADVLLPLSFRMRERPMSALVIVAFPIVHHELASGQASPTLLSLIPFFDWDRCHTLRRDLVDAFMQSKWPPADLLVAADGAGELDRVIDLISHRYGSHSYFGKIERDLSRLGPSARRRYRFALERRDTGYLDS